VSRAELIGLMAALIYRPAGPVTDPDEALDMAVYFTEEAEKRCQRAAPQMQEFELEDEKAARLGGLPT